MADSSDVRGRRRIRHKAEDEAERCADDAHDSSPLRPESPEPPAPRRPNPRMGKAPGLEAQPASDDPVPVQAGRQSGQGPHDRSQQHHDPAEQDLVLCDHPM
jgi:hypothetical protein